MFRRHVHIRKTWMPKFPRGPRETAPRSCRGRGCLCCVLLAMEYGMPPPPPSAPPSTAAITRAIEIAALELTRSALSSPSLEVSSRAPRHVRDKFLKASCAGQMSTEEVNSLVRSSCKGVHPLVQCVTAELRTVVDPRLERIRSGCNDMLKLRVADAVKAIRSPATAAISPADHAKRIIKRIDEAHAKAQAKLSAVMTTNVEAQRSSWSRQIEPLLEQGGPDSESVLGHELLARVCALAVELRCVKAYTTEEALNARLTEAAAVEAGVAAADMAEAVGQQAAVEEAIARLRLARDAAELGVALVAARMANVPASVVELAEMRLGEMRALPPTPRGAPPVTAPVTAPPVAPAASTAADDSAVPSALARPDGALTRALVRRMTEKERIEAAIAASRVTASATAVSGAGAGGASGAAGAWTGHSPPNVFHSPSPVSTTTPSREQQIRAARQSVELPTPAPLSRFSTAPNLTAAAAAALPERRTEQTMDPFPSAVPSAGARAPLSAYHQTADPFPSGARGGASDPFAGAGAGAGAQAPIPTRVPTTMRVPSLACISTASSSTPLTSASSATPFTAAPMTAPAPMPAPLPPMPMTARRRNLGALDQDAVQVRSPLIALALYLMVLDGPFLPLMSFVMLDRAAARGRHYSRHRRVGGEPRVGQGRLRHGLRSGRGPSGRARAQREGGCEAHGRLQHAGRAPAAERD
jgi:hypothetical protein